MTTRLCRFLEPGPGRSKTGRLWAYLRADRPSCSVAPPSVAYFYSPDRTGAHQAVHLANFTGFLQADGYSGFSKLYDPGRTKPGPITEVACWAHTRRGFFEDWEQHKSPTAKQALDMIAAVYDIEARAAPAPIVERVAEKNLATNVGNLALVRATDIHKCQVRPREQRSCALAVCAQVG